MSFNFSAPRDGDSSFQKRENALANWEKHRQNGKWFWLFKRSAVWLTALILLFGAANFLFPDNLSFQAIHIFIALFMFGGYFLGSLNEWAEMEKLSQTQSFSGE